MESKNQEAQKQVELGDPIPDTPYSMEYEISVMFYWDWSKGERRTWDSPGEPAHLEDVTVMLGEHDITEMLSPEVLVNVHEAMLQEMEYGRYG